MVLFLLLCSTAAASVRDEFVRIVSSYSQDPVRITRIQASFRGFSEEKDYEVLSYRVQMDAGRAWFLLGSGGRTFWVQAVFLVQRPAVVAKRLIERGERIDAVSVEKRLIWVSPARARGLLGYADALGKVATRNIPPGTMIKASMVKRPLAVKRGQLVKFLLRVGAVEIDGVAKAMASGAVGDTVELRNLSSGRIFTGEVIGEGRVLVR